MRSLKLQLMRREFGAFRVSSTTRRELTLIIRR
jgi:hypothetical protein